MMNKLLNQINLKIGRLFIGWRPMNKDDPYPPQSGVNVEGYNSWDHKWDVFVIEWDGRNAVDVFIICYRIS